MFLKPVQVLALAIQSQILIVSTVQQFHQKSMLFLRLCTDALLVRADKEDWLPEFYGRVKDLHWQQKISGNLIYNSKNQMYLRTYFLNDIIICNFLLNFELPNKYLPFKKLKQLVSHFNTLSCQISQVSIPVLFLIHWCSNNYNIVRTNSFSRSRRSSLFGKEEKWNYFAPTKRCWPLSKWLNKI